MLMVQYTFLIIDLLINTFSELFRFESVILLVIFVSVDDNDSDSEIDFKYFQYPGCLSCLLPHHRFPLLLLYLRLSGWPGGLAGLQIQGTHNDIHHVLGALHWISRQFS